MALTPGTKLGPYEIVAPLGAGGMGEVYRARDVRLGRDVAIKILPASFSEDADRLHRFEHEARILSTLNHPNLLAIYDVGEQDGVHFLVSELLEGESIRQRIQKGGVPGRKAIQYAVQIAKGLAAAHDKGIVHRDLKPENLFLIADSRVKILDFGLAKQAATHDSKEGATLTSPATQPGMVLGTIGYMSPEQVRGQAADSRSDIFSFGAILYEMFAGTRAFEGSSSVETMHAILKEDPPEITKASKKIPPETDRLIRRCLEKAPEERFQSARDLAFALEALSSGSGIAAASAFSHPDRVLAFPISNWRFWAAFAAGLLVALLGALWLRHPAPALEFVQLTNDSYAKNNIGWPPPVFDTPLATDGARLYLTVNLDTGATPAQVSIRGGETVPIHLPLSYSGFQLLGNSADGSELLVESFMGTEVEVPIWIVPALGGSPRRLGALTAHDVAWSSDKQFVAFASGNGLFLLDTNNGKREIFTANGVVFWPRWSPDGKRLRFTVEDSSTLSSTLWEVHADGTNPHILLPGWNKPSIECCGEWTHDGRAYVFQTGTFAHSDLWAVAEGLFGESRPFRLTSGPLSFSAPLPSPDGQWLYMVGTQRRYELVRLELVSGLATPLASVPSLESIDYSRDGKWMVYVSHPDGILWRSRADGSDRLQLTYPPIIARAPKWSPDGTQIAFVGTRAGQPLQIQLVAAEGGSTQAVFSEARNQGSPTWLPDGQSLIFGRQPWLESSKSTPVLLEKVNLRTHQLSDVAGSDDMLAPAVSLDGKFLAALHTVGTQVALYEFATGKWNILDQASMYQLAWAPDSSAVYFITRHGELYSYRVANRQLKSVMKVAGHMTVMGSQLEGMGFLLIGPDGAPLLIRDQRSSQLYALKWRKR
jgi:Tol biopolymer transport system component